MFKFLRRLSYLSLAIPNIVLAAAGAGGDHGHIPWMQLITPQIFNFILFVGLLIYFTRGQVLSYFSTKAEKFHAAKNAAKKAKEDAEAKHLVIRNKIDSLKATEASEVAKAKISATQLKESLIQAAKTQSEKIQADAVASIQAELQKAILTLRTEAISESVNLAGKELQNAKAGAEMQRSFASRAQGAQV